MTSLLTRKCIRLSKLIPRSTAFCTTKEPETTDAYDALIGISKSKQAENDSFIDVTKVYRTEKSDPGQHNKDNLGLYYTIPKNVDSKELFRKPRTFSRLCNTFNETGIMIRSPALEVIHYLKHADYSHPIQKYVIYGNRGGGKTLSLLHILHYAHLHNFLIVNVPYVKDLLKYSHADSKAISEFKPGHLDLPVKAVTWLKYFLNQNLHILKNETDLTLAKDFTWNARETSKAGDSVLSLVNFGIERGKYASHVIFLLIEELKRLSKEEKIRTLVAIDGFNAFFSTYTKIQDEEKKLVPPERLTLLEPFLNLTKADWHNGAAVLVLDSYAVYDKEKAGNPLTKDPLAKYEEFLPDSPVSLLGTKGFEHLDPFIPIEVKFMSNFEMTSMLAYFRDRKWLGRTEGDEELKFLCGGCPYELRELCKAIY